MKVLHISNDFAGSKVHSNLIRALDKFDIEQVVYCPIREQSLYGKNKFDGRGVEFIYSYIIRHWHKYFYHYKQRTIYKDLQKKVKLSQIDIVHAATLYTDGGIAYKIHQDYGIPYVVAIRNTDINTFAKLQPHLVTYARRILLNASKIYFISKALQAEFEQLTLAKPILRKIKSKFTFRPNGIDDFWLNNISQESNSGKDVLYVGDFSQNKNVERLIEAIKIVREKTKHSTVKLTIVGGGKDKNNLTSNYLQQNNDCVTYLGPIYDKEQLCLVMRQHALFAMPSIHETFGLVYIEAISQNLPVVHTKGQGIDGLFLGEEPWIAVGTDALSVEDISKSILYVLDNRHKFSNKDVDFSLFDWTLISKQYYLDYTSIFA